MGWFTGLSAAIAALLGALAGALVVFILMYFTYHGLLIKVPLIFWNPEIGWDGVILKEKKISYQAGFDTARAVCKENEVRGLNERLQQDLASTKEQLDLSREREGARASANAILREQVNDLNEQLETEAVAAPTGCTYERIGPRLRQRLHNSWGVGGPRNGKTSGGE